MNIQTVKLSAIKPPADNPRQSFNKDTLEGLADSIKADGLLQNLVVTPTRGKKYRIISGERRYRALQLLLENGDIAGDYEIPVEIRKNLSKQDKLRLATVENVQRENLHPMDEAEAFAALAQKGTSLADLAAETGLAEKTVKRRLAIASLCDETKQALRDDKITLSIAEAMTLGTPDAQCTMLEHIDNGNRVDSDDIREFFIRRKPSVSLAIFPLEQYQGTFTKDLFADEESTYFDDEEQFLALQKQAVTERAEQYTENGAAFVEVTEAYSIPTWHYRDPEEDETPGIAINLSPRGEVLIVGNLVKHAIDEETAEETAETPAAPAKPKPFYSAPLCRNMAQHKSMAVQAELLAHPRICKILSIIGLLGNRTVHECLKEFDKVDTPPTGYTVVNDTATAFLDLLPGVPDNGDESPWLTLKYGYFDSVQVYDTLLAVHDDQLDDLLAVLTVMHFGQGSCDSLDTWEDSLFNRIAQDIDVNMLNHWRPDAEFLKRRNKDQLIQIAIDAGANTRLGAMSSYKKSDLVTQLERYFTRISQEDTPSGDDLKALSWLPEAMLFPAVDPMDQQDETEDDSLPQAA
jgi:ParB family chromosome partitioning protein